MTAAARLGLAVASALGAAASLAGCGDDAGTLRPNLAPHVEITAGPRPGSSSFYAVPISWTAWDDDGTIDHSLYTVDRTDTAWTSTREFTTTLVVSAADTADVGSGDQGWHTFYVKSVDNEGAESAPVQVSFSARTIAPQSRILFPAAVAAGQGYNAALLGGPSLLLRWTGVDVDGVERTTPTHYMFKRLVVPSSVLGNVAAAAEMLEDPVEPWQMLEAPHDTMELRWTDLVGNEGVRYWVFALRAVDEAGAVERDYLPGNNLFFFAAYTLRQGPVLTAQNVNLGQFQWQGNGRDSAQYVFDAAIGLSWSGDPGTSGATISGYRWGVDVTDIENEQDPGWATGWSRAVTGISGLYFRDRTQPEHSIVIQAQDSNGAVTTGVLRLSLITFTGERDVLWVDDYYDIGATGLLATEAYHRETALTSLGIALAAIGRPAAVDTFQCFPVYVDPLYRTPPKLGDLAKYKVVVWDAGNPPGVSLFDVTSVRSGRPRTRPNQIASYLDAGGTLVLVGNGAVRATIDPVPTQTPITSSTLTPGRGNFAADYMHVADQVAYAREDAKRNGLLGLVPTEWGRTHGVPGGGGFQQLDFDTVTWYRIAPTGRLGAEAMTGFYHPGAGDRVDEIYTYSAAGGATGPYASTLHGKVDGIIFRRAPRDPAIEDWNYQVAYVSFTLVDMYRDQVTSMFTNLLWEILQDRKYGLTLVPTNAAAPRSPPGRLDSRPGGG